MEKLTRTDLFLKLAEPNEKGESRWVDVSEFVGEYARLKFGNGASWARKESTLAKKYIIEFDKSKTPGNGIDRIRLNGFNDNDFSQHINAEIKRIIKSQRCVVLGTSNPEVDHKNGMKNESRVMRNEEQRLSDFQPLSKAANDAKGSFVRNAGAPAYALMPKLSAILCPIMPEEEPTTLKKMPAWDATGMTLWSLKDI